ncbi:putative reverse transcriptase domain-containing protein [Tanacetum coccineum]
MGTFLLNNHYASILFDTGADRSFISTAFSSLINIAPTPLENSYDVELADGKIVRIDTIIRGCTLNFLDHPFNIDLMPVELGSFDVIIGMDWLRRCHAMIVCDEKLVRVPYGNETLTFRGKKSSNKRESWLTVISCLKAQEYMAKGCQVFLAQISAKKEEDKSEGKQLKDVPIVRDFPEVFPEDLPGLPPTRPVEFQIDLIPGAAPEKLMPSLSKCEFWIPKVTLPRTRSIDSKGIHVDPAKIESIKDWASPKTSMEIRQFLGLAGYYRSAPILALPEGSKGFGHVCDHTKGVGSFNDADRRSSNSTETCVNQTVLRDGRFTSKLFGNHFRKLWVQKALGTDISMSTAYHPETDGQSERTIQTLEDMLRACVIDFGKGWVKHLPLAEFSYNNSYHASIKAAPYEALYGRKCRSPVCWAEVGEAQLTGPELIQETTEKIVLIKQRMQAAQDRQKSYADRKRKPMEFEVGDRVMLKVSPWKGVVRFGKRGKLNPRYVGPFKVLAKVGKVAYRLELPQELSRVHHTFHVSNLKKCYADEPLVMPLEGIHVDDKLQFVEEPVEIMEREIKRLKRSRIPLVKVRWNSRRGPEFTWEREDSFKQKYPQLFTNRASSSTTRS